MPWPAGLDVIVMPLGPFVLLARIFMGALIYFIGPDEQYLRGALSAAADTGDS